ncbi:hypothetical protein JCM33374_g385 [Metschnikowia sp. JCM 33374]|nr:hypothetical protein JCM33374_g385 [Metschnikowia sp. JCM 33374]
MSSAADFSGVRQLLLQHAYSPLVSVQSTHNADSVFQSVCANPSISALSVLKPYGNTAKYGIPNQAYRITNTSLITRNYGSFPVRFEPCLSELLTVHNPCEDKLSSLFSISSLELLMRNFSQKPPQDPDVVPHSLYLSMFRKIITSNRVVSFDTLNHPVAQIFVVDFASDSLDDIRRMVVEFRNFKFPKPVSEMIFSLSSTGIPVNGPETDATDYCAMPEFENATIDQEVQNITLQMAHSEQDSGLRVPKTLDATLRTKVFEFVSRSLIPHMERKIRTWDDGVLAPKKSIAGRFFSVSRKLFNTNIPNENPSQSTTPGVYDHVGNFYHRSAPEQIIRKLADWSLMLKDFKYAYSTYDVIKKDYTNDKAWAYVASTQEMCIVSLLLAQTQPLASDTLPQKPDKNTLRKIRHDIIEPYVDNLSYTYKQRFNVKTYAVRSYLVVAELLLNMSMMFNIPWWWSDLIEDYFMKAEHELESHLAVAGKGPQATRAILYERLGFVKRHSFFIPTGRRDIINHVFENGIVPVESEECEEGFYVNKAKLAPYNDTAVKGLTRFRKSSFWYIMSMNEWMLLENAGQIRLLSDKLSIRYALTDKTNEWYTREDLVLARINRFVSDSV